MEVMVKLDGIFDCLNSLMVARNELNCRDLVTTDNRIHPFVLTVSGCGQWVRLLTSL